MTIPITITIESDMLRLESIQENVTAFDVSDADFADCIKFEHMLDAVDNDNVYFSTDLMTTLRAQSETNAQVFYLIVCKKYMFIVEEDHDLTIIYPHLPEKKGRR